MALRTMLVRDCFDRELLITLSVQTVAFFRGWSKNDGGFFQMGSHNSLTSQRYSTAADHSSPGAIVRHPESMPRFARFEASAEQV